MTAPIKFNAILLKTVVLSLVFSILVPIQSGHRFGLRFVSEALAIVAPDPICQDKWDLRDSKKDVFQKCIDQLSEPGQPSVGNQKEPPCVHEFQALIQAAKELRDCLKH